MSQQRANKSFATISECGTYRYTLWRHLGLLGPPCLFVMLNPSTADANQDDPTIRRCIAFARSWGCGELTVVNLLALRATDPSILLRHSEPNGPDNVAHIENQLRIHEDGIIVLAWGAHRAHSLSVALNSVSWPGSTTCLGVTNNGSPRHPLYLRRDQPLMSYAVSRG